MFYIVIFNLIGEPRLSYDHTIKKKNMSPAFNFNLAAPLNTSPILYAETRHCDSDMGTKQGIGACIRSRPDSGSGLGSGRYFWSGLGSGRYL